MCGQEERELICSRGKGMTDLKFFSSCTFWLPWKNVTKVSFSIMFLELLKCSWFNS